MTPITCRSPQEIEDDTLTHYHDAANEALNAMSCGVCLYRGQTRRLLQEFKADIEDVILGKRTYGAAFGGVPLGLVLTVILRG